MFVDSNGNVVPSSGTDTFSIVTLASFVLVKTHVTLSSTHLMLPTTMIISSSQVTSLLNHTSGSGISSLA